MGKTLYIDIGLCSECKGCVEIAPNIFQFNNETGYMEVIDSKDYDEELIAEAMKNCPENCIKWDGKIANYKSAPEHSDSVSVVEIL